MYNVYIQNWELPAAREFLWGNSHLSMAGGIDMSYQWIGLRENLQETIDFPIKYGAFL